MPLKRGVDDPFSWGYSPDLMGRGACFSRPPRQFCRGGRLAKDGGKAPDPPYLLRVVPINLNKDLNTSDLPNLLNLSYFPDFLNLFNLFYFTPLTTKKENAIICVLAGK